MTIASQTTKLPGGPKPASAASSSTPAQATNSGEGMGEVMGEVARELLAQLQATRQELRELRATMEARPVVEEWSPAMPKAEIASRLRMRRYEFEAFAREAGLRQAGSRQLWQIALHRLSPEQRSELGRSQQKLAEVSR